MHYNLNDMAEHNILGKWGEAEAAAFLGRKGYVIKECDWRIGKRDIDIVALSPDWRELVFVEVKTRSDNRWREPEQAIDRKKIRNLSFAANAYLKVHQVQLECRFDIITIIGHRPVVERIEHIENAFNPLLSF